MQEERAQKIAGFDPNGVGLHNGHFIGLPFEEAEAQVVLQPVPWDVTVSFGEGTSTGPQNILDASAQLDLFDPDVADAWKIGLFFRPVDEDWLAESRRLRKKCQQYIQFLESGRNPQQFEEMETLRQELNEAGARHTQKVKETCSALLEAGKWVGLIGGDHSCPLGYLQALAERHNQFGVLQIDAHMDLRPAYEGLTYSHASIFYEALRIPQIKKLVQVGIRDYCEEEYQFAHQQPDRIHVWFEHERQEALFQGEGWQSICRDWIDDLPEKVYISFDVDGLEPSLCPQTGTPVPGGLTWAEALFLLRELEHSGRTIIGFDLCETAGLGSPWDGNVAARLAYKLANLGAKSNGMHKNL